MASQWTRYPSCMLGTPTMKYSTIFLMKDTWMRVYGINLLPAMLRWTLNSYVST